jgi:hypothetical protein
MPNTADKDDVNVDWTVQTRQPPKPVEALDGQFFHTSQLPDPKVQAELSPVYADLWKNVNGNLPVTDDRDEAIAHPRGPERAELDAADERRAAAEKRAGKDDDNAKKADKKDSGVPAQN